MKSLGLRVGVPGLFRVYGLEFRVSGFQARGLPRGSYPTPFLGHLLLKITDPNHKTRYPKKGLGYEPLGRMSDNEKVLLSG